MKKYFFIVALLISSTGKSDSIQSLSYEANQAVTHLSYCSEEFTQLVNNRAFIGNVERFDKDNGSYGFTYYVYRQNYFTSQESVGSIQLLAALRDNVPEDISRYSYTCKIIPPVKRYP